MHRNLKLDVICSTLILLFTYTAVSKWMDFHRFQLVLQQSPLIRKIAFLLSWSIPLLEILISVLLLIPAYRKAGLVFSFLLLAFFTLYIAYLLLYVPHLPCSCGGVIQQISWRQHLLFNLFFTGLSGVGIYLIKKPRNWSPLIPYPNQEDIL